MIKIKSIKRKNLILGLIVLFTFVNFKQAFGQHTPADSTKSLTGFLKKGKLNFHSRTYLMSTLNKESENNFFALATAVGVKYSTPAFHGFQIKAGGYLSFRLAEYNLVDSETGKWTNNRYEKVLYDINDPNNKYNLGVLDEVYLSYTHKN